jgi:hypothetical protein
MINASEVVTLIFSKDRLLQLDLLLNTLFEKCKDIYSTDVKIIYKGSTKEIEDLYKQMSQEYFQQVDFIQQTNFRDDVLKSIQGYKYVLFLVDDCIFFGNFSLSSIVNMMERIQDAIGFSLRLGENINYCYSLNATQSIPNFSKMRDGIIFFEWLYAECDFGYPLEVSSSLYRIQDLLPILHDEIYNNPNELESILYGNLSLFVPKFTKLLSYRTSVAFCAPLNKVQKTHPNRSGSMAVYEPANLIHLYQIGFRVDSSRFDGFIPHAPHQEVEFFNV